MKASVCPQEGAVWRAARSAYWDESLTAHVRECSVCGEIIQTTRWMQTLAGRAENALALPDAGLLWRQSRLSEKQAEIERALKPLAAMEVLPVAVAALALVGWFVWDLSSAGGFAAWVLTRLLPQVWRITWTVTTTGQEFFSSGVFFGAAVILSLVAVFATAPLLARE